MIVQVKLFAVARQLAGCETMELNLPDGANVQQLRAALLTEVPALESLASMLLFAVNHDYVSDNSLIPKGADVACIPPVSGG